MFYIANEELENWRQWSIGRSRDSARYVPAVMAC